MLDQQSWQRTQRQLSHPWQQGSVACMQNYTTLLQGVDS